LVDPREPGKMAAVMDVECGCIECCLLLWHYCCVHAAEDDSLFDKVNRWPTLFASCYCDVYSSWSREAYISIAERWLFLEPATVVIVFIAKTFTYFRI